MNGCSLIQNIKPNGGADVMPYVLRTHNPALNQFMEKLETEKPSLLKLFDVGETVAKSMQDVADAVGFPHVIKDMDLPWGGSGGILAQLWPYVVAYKEK